MSKPNPELSHAKADIRRYVGYLAAMPYVSAVFIVGSRSPLNKKQHRVDSDWDLMPLRTGDGFILRPRKFPFKLLADLMAFRERPDAVEIWPTDQYGVLQ